MAGKSNKSSDQRLASLNLAFSFEYYDISNDSLFCISDWAKDDIKHTLARLRDICTKTLFDMQRERKVYHFTPTDWSKSMYPGGFPDPIKSLNNLDPFHFAILGLNHQKARVFGAVAGSIFYVVWFDRDHDILPYILKNT